jgi:hypothetical protein
VTNSPRTLGIRAPIRTRVLNGRYWGHSGHLSALALIDLVANDPMRTCVARTQAWRLISTATVNSSFVLPEPVAEALGRWQSQSVLRKLTRSVFCCSVKPMPKR